MQKTQHTTQRALVLILLLVMFFAVLSSLTGCKKCAQCYTTVTQTVTGQMPVTSKSQTELCGDDLKQADGQETTSTATVNGHTATIYSKTTCY